MAKRQRDPERERFWRRTFSAWQASGQSIREYCEQHDVTETSFHYWRRELRQRDARVSTGGATPAFVPVRVIPSIWGHMASSNPADAPFIDQALNDALNGG
jgi:ferric-dicitrate binding protein FerR (iron transport regulator)